MKQVTSVLILAILFLPIQFNAQVVSEEYQVYKTIIDSLVIKTNAPFIILSDSIGTSQVIREIPYYELDLLHMTRILPKPEQQALLKNYLEVNAHSSRLDSSQLEVAIPTYFSSPSECLSLLRRKYREHGMIRDYKDTRRLGIFHFTRVGFNSDSTYALLFYDYHCWGLCGWPAYCLLEKKQSKWHIVLDYPLGVY